MEWEGKERTPAPSPLPLPLVNSPLMKILKNILTMAFQVVAMRFRGEEVFFDALLKKVQRKYNSKELQLVGAWFNTKDSAFQWSIAYDIIYGAVAILLVVLSLLLYTSSFLFTVAVSLSLVLSIGVAYFVYTVS